MCNDKSNQVICGTTGRGKTDVGNWKAGVGRSMGARGGISCVPPEPPRYLFS